MTQSTGLLGQVRLHDRYDSLDALVVRMAIDQARAREALDRERGSMRQAVKWGQFG